MIVNDDRCDNGSRRRMDGKGDPWANAHRTALDKCHMVDIDGVFGLTAFGHNTGEHLFLECVPDHWENRLSALRQFAVVAMFDRKQYDGAQNKGGGPFSFAFYLHLCRVLSERQPSPARFFYVFGQNEPPWVMQEHDIDTGIKCGTPIRLDGLDWTTVWESIGLKRERDVLRKWTESKESAA